ncbi:MAG: hypothetical protein LBR31_04875 [Desulfovibrio sp.]|jgi:hypothetical protein|nr:hypothetical protein [Desulfovibrio sp.]
MRLPGPEKDPAGLENLARLSYKHGFLGSGCIHPTTVEILNKAFSPAPEAVARARELMAALDAAFAEGKAAITLGNEMVDIANHKKAQALVARADLIEAHEMRKRKAREAMAYKINFRAYNTQGREDAPGLGLHGQRDRIFR